MAKSSEASTLHQLQTGFLEQNRNDLWWVRPVIEASILTALLIYSLWAVLFGYEHSSAPDLHPYLSPLFVPDFEPSWWSPRLPPGLLAIWIPVGLRATCYYSRRVYYRAFFADPPACAVGETPLSTNRYKGETSLPWILNNIHRYFVFLAFIVAFFHFWVLLNSFVYNGKFYIGVGNLIVFSAVFFLTFYILSCHATRHFVGGCLNCFSCSTSTRTRFKLWKGISWMNKKHGQDFWLSLILITVADIYIRLVSMGIITDPHLGG